MDIGGDALTGTSTTEHENPASADGVHHSNVQSGSSIRDAVKEDEIHRLQGRLDSVQKAYKERNPLVRKIGMFCDQHECLTPHS